MESVPANSVSNSLIGLGNTSPDSHRSGQHGKIDTGSKSQENNEHVLVARNLLNVPFICTAVCYTGHLISGGDGETGVHDGVEAVLEQCRAQNRQLISEMRKTKSYFRFLCLNAQYWKHVILYYICKQLNTCMRTHIVQLLLNQLVFPWASWFLLGKYFGMLLNFADSTTEQQNCLYATNQDDIIYLFIFFLI